MIPIIKIIKFIPIKVLQYAESLNNLLLAPTIVKDGTSKGFNHLTKLIASSTGGVGIGKGSVDALEAYACNDKICMIISCVGVAADGLQVVASLVPGPNVTVFVTVPISLSCKTFVWACKRSKLPWGNC